MFALNYLIFNLNAIKVKYRLEEFAQKFNPVNVGLLKKSFCGVFCVEFLAIVLENQRIF